MAKHEQSHEVSDYQCFMCNTMFVDEAHKSAHECTATLKGSIQCPRCPQKMHNYFQLASHTEVVHKIECPVKKVGCLATIAVTQT